MKNLQEGEQPSLIQLTDSKLPMQVLARGLKLGVQRPSHELMKSGRDFL